MSLNYPFPRQREEYSFVWLNGGTLILLSGLIPVFQLHSVVRLLIQGIQSDIDETCHDINNAVFHLRDLPNALSLHVLKTASTSIENLQRILIALVSLIEYCVIWLIGVYKSTYRCLFGLAINTVLALATSITQPIQQVATTVWDGITKGINSISGSNLTEASGEFPANWTDTMENVRSKVFNWTQGPDTMALVGTPFEAIKTRINNTFVDWTPPPLQFTAALTTDHQECDPSSLKNMIKGLEDKIGAIIWTYVGFVLLLVGLSTLFSFFFTYISHYHLEDKRSLNSTAGWQRPRVSNNAGPDELHLLAQEHRYPGVSIIITFIKEKSNFSKGYMDILEWWTTFLGNPFTLYCLFLGICGLLTSYILLWTLRSLMAQTILEFDAQAVAWTKDTTTRIVQSVYGRNTKDVLVLNDWISQTEAAINEHAFGFIRSVSLSLNDTLSGVVDDLTGLIKTAFGGTIFEDPVKGVVSCLLLVKIENVEQGLTWIVDNVHVNLTRIDPSILALTPLPDVVAQTTSLVLLSENSNSSMLASLDSYIDTHLTNNILYYWILIIIWVVCVLIGFGLFSIRYWVEMPVSRPLDYIRAYNESYGDNIREDYTMKRRY
ncbi:hypothetical protein CLU79DRAFT_795170 [Phycomyces nitens]|nr:hypothetical protein CLU79DRAFT_795170 [Phycomyces nitens]